jgi:hypothetical protein
VYGLGSEIVMALARIITRSHACSRELALDLLARGYAVEIVSPDSIPDNIADLELRVDTAPGDRLIASVEAHDGGRSASLEFVHHLKAPMVDFMRRPPEPGETVHVSEQPVGFNAAPDIGVVELPAGAPQPAANTVSPAVEILVDPVLDPPPLDPPKPGPRKLDPIESARPILPPDPLPSPSLELPSYFAVEDSPIALSIAQPKVAQPTVALPKIVLPTLVQPKLAPRARHRSAGWSWRATLTFAGVVLLALVLGFGMRQAGEDSVQSSESAPAEKVAAASTAVDLLSAAAPEKDSEKAPEKDPGQVPPLAVSPPATKSVANSGDTPKESPVVNEGAAVAETSTASAATTVSPSHGDGLIARDTVTYLDDRYKPAPKATPANHFAGRHPSSRAQGGIVAANSVTNLNSKPTPKPATPDSAIQHPSNSN